MERDGWTKKVPALFSVPGGAAFCRPANQSAQGSIDGSIVGEMLGYIGRKEHEIGASPVPFGVFAANLTPALERFLSRKDSEGVQ